MTFKKCATFPVIFIEANKTTLVCQWDSVVYVLQHTALTGT